MCALKYSHQEEDFFFLRKIGCLNLGFGRIRPLPTINVFSLLLSRVIFWFIKFSSISLWVLQVFFFGCGIPNIFKLRFGVHSLWSNLLILQNTGIIALTASKISQDENYKVFLLMILLSTILQCLKKEVFQCLYHPLSKIVLFCTNITCIGYWLYICIYWMIKNHMGF